MLQIQRKGALDSHDQRRRIRRGKARRRPHSAYGTLLGIHKHGTATREL